MITSSSATMTKHLGLNYCAITKSLINYSLKKMNLIKISSQPSQNCSYILNNKTNLLEAYVNFVEALYSKRVNYLDRMQSMHVNFVDTAKKQCTIFKLNIFFYFIPISNFFSQSSTSSLEQIPKTGYLEANLILRQYKLNLMSRFLEHKSVKPELRQDQIAKELG